MDRGVSAGSFEAVDAGISASERIDVFPSSGRAYRIRTFEVQRHLIEADASIGESELENTTSQIVFNEPDLLRALDVLRINIESLDLPSKSDYPI